MRARRFVTLLFVVFALAATVGHICVLPGHVDAAPGAYGHDDEQPAAEHSGSATDTFHAASCEALRPAATTSATPSVIGMAALPRSVDLSRGRKAHRMDAPPPTGSPPPLYLVHRAFLI